jgi:hypothetical protein
MVLEGRDLETVQRECERINYGKVIIQLYSGAVVGIQTEESRRVMSKPKA